MQTTKEKKPLAITSLLCAERTTNYQNGSYTSSEGAYSVRNIAHSTHPEIATSPILHSLVTKITNRHCPPNNVLRVEAPYSMLPQKYTPHIICVMFRVNSNDPLLYY